MAATEKTARAPLDVACTSAQSVPIAILLALMLLATSGCASPGGSSESARMWPPDSPRVRLSAVVTVRSGRVERWLRTLTGGERQTLLQRPYGVAWDGDDLLVTDPDAGRVLRIALGGRVLAKGRQPMTSPIGVAKCDRGIVVTDSATGDVLLLDRALRIRDRLATALRRPTGVACAGGEIFVAETAAHRVRVLSDGGETRSLGRRGAAPGEFNYPTSLAVDGDGLWVGDSMNFRVQRIETTTGAPLDSFGRLGDAPGEMPRVKGLAMDAGGRLWVADAHLDGISMYRRDGTYLMTIGLRGDEPGAFSFPAGIAAGPRGDVAVVDSFNRRIQIFRLVGSKNGLP